MEGLPKGIAKKAIADILLRMKNARLKEAEHSIVDHALHIEQKELLYIECKLLQAEIKALEEIIEE